MLLRYDLTFFLVSKCYFHSAEGFSFDSKVARRREVQRMPCSLSPCIMCSHPDHTHLQSLSVLTMMQQKGRAGREARTSISVVTL